MWLLACPFDENREVEKKITESVNKFHTLLNQDKFNQIYSEADNELKSNFTKSQFIPYLKSIKENDDEAIKEISHVWLDDNLKDGIKKNFVTKTKFNQVELVATEKRFIGKNLFGIYRAKKQN